MNIMKIFGFDNDEDDYENDDYAEEKRSEKKSSGRRAVSSQRSGSEMPGKIIIYNGVANDIDKRRLREAFNEGAMILIDLHNLNQLEFEEEGKDFITFMGGVAFARNGDMKYIEPAQYLVTPRTDMYEVWPEETDHE